MNAQEEANALWTIINGGREKKKKPYDIVVFQMNLSKKKLNKSPDKQRKNNGWSIS